MFKEHKEFGEHKELKEHQLANSSKKLLERIKEMVQNYEELGLIKVGLENPGRNKAIEVDTRIGNREFHFRYEKDKIGERLFLGIGQPGEPGWQAIEVSTSPYLFQKMLDFAQTLRDDNLEFTQRYSGQDAVKEIENFLNQLEFLLRSRAVKTSPSV